VYGTLIFQLLLWAYVGLVYIDFDLPDRPQYPAQRPFHKNVETDHLIRPSRETVWIYRQSGLAPLFSASCLSSP